MKTRKRIYILILSALLIISMMPFYAFADAPDNSSTESGANTENVATEQQKSDEDKSSDDSEVDEKSEPAKKSEPAEKSETDSAKTKEDVSEEEKTETDMSSENDNSADDDKVIIEENEKADADEPSNNDKTSEEARKQPSVEVNEQASEEIYAESDAEMEEDNKSESDPVHFTGKAGDVEVIVEATKDAFPEGTRMKVSKVEDEDIYKAIDDTVDGNIKTVKAVDITFINAKGNEIQPTEPIKVTLKSKAVAEVKSPVVVHVEKDSNNEFVVEKVGDARKNKNNEKEVSFEAEHFSVYAVVETGEDQTIRATYNFQNEDGTPYEFINNAGNHVTSQIIKNGEYLEDVGRPNISEGETFSGWYIYNEDGTYGDKIEFGSSHPIAVTSNATYTVRPVFGDVVYLNFYEDSEGTHVYQRVQLALTDGSATYNINQQSVDAPKANLAFMGWSETSGTDNDDREPITNTNVTVSENKNYYPVYKSAHWIHFHANPDGESGASYTSPKYVLVGQQASAVKPSNPTWKGHTFKYWSTTKPTYDSNGNLTNNPQEFNWNQTLSEDTELYAVWENADTTYTVIFWKQKVTDDKNASDAAKTYDYAGQETETATSGSTVSAADFENHYTGFTVNTGKSDSSITVKADGSSVINVYFDRKLMTMQFYKNGNNTGDPGYNSQYWTNGSNRVKTMTGLYGQTLSQNGYKWPGDSVWNYYTSNGTGTMSYLGEFVFGSENGIDVRDPEDQLFRAYQASVNGQHTIHYYLEQPDGSYDEDSEGVLDENFWGAIFGQGGVFTFTEKYDGYNVAHYLRYQSGTSPTGNMVNASSGQTVELTSTIWLLFIPITTYYDLNVYYDLQSHNIKFLDPTDGTELNGVSFTNSGANPVTNGVGSVKYTAPLSNYEPPASVVPVSQYPGKVWDGKWYADQACTVEFDWSQTMPNGDVAVYAGWTDEYYRVEVDPNGGQLSATEATYFWLTYGQTVQQYSDISRNYIEDPDGSYYYYNNGWDPSWPDSADGDPRAARIARYSTDSSITIGDVTLQPDGKKYSYKQDAYSLVGWYKVNADGSLGEPYDFSTQITENTKIRAVWRITGDYKVVYDVDAVDENGNVLTTDDGQPVNASFVPTDGNNYGDKSDTSMLGKASVPDGYVFKGWYYDGKVYNPGDVYTVIAELADDENKVHIKPVFEPYDEVPIRTTHIHWYANNGTEDVVKDDDLELNKDVDIRPADTFTYEGHEFIGWAKTADASTPWLAYDSETGKFTENGIEVTKVAADEKLPYDDLYAVWKVKTYKVTIKKVVEGTAADKNQQFTFTSSALQQANFGLKDGETKEFTEVPYGKTFNLREETGGAAASFTPSVVCVVTDDDGNKTTTTPENGADYTVEGDMEITYTNTRKTQPVVFKKIGSDTEAALPGAEYELWKLNAQGEKTGSAIATLVSGESGYLASGDTVQFDLEAGSYRLVETQAPTGYRSQNVDFTVSTDAVSASGDNVEVSSPTSTERFYLLTVSDDPLPELLVSKSVSGLYADLTTAFNFTLDLNGDTGEYDYIIYETGDEDKTAISTGKISDGGTFALTDGQTMEIINLPYGVEYKVTEEENPNYLTKYNDMADPAYASGTLTSTTKINVSNVMRDIIITGIDGRNAALIVVILGVLAGACLFMLKRAKHKRELRR